MAGVYWKNGKWYARYKDGLGVWRNKALPGAETKTAAKVLAAELAHGGWRQREGLDVLPSDCRMTLAELVEWWLEKKCPELSRGRERLRLKKNVCDRPIGSIQVPKVTDAVIDKHLDELEKEGLAPATLNHIRSKLRTVFNRARKAKIWVGANPVVDVEVRRGAKRVYATLRAEEVSVFLAHVEESWRPLFAAALYTAMRKGELLGLQKADVDLAAKQLVVARSYDHDTTKGKHADVIPVAEPLVAYLQQAIEAAKGSDLVFPIRGEMGKTHEPLHRVLRRALAGAGLVLGWDHVCRRCKGKKAKQHTWRHEDSAERTCPECGMRLWAKAVPRPIRFHDLRHTTATLLLRAKVPAHHVQRILRHASIVTTTNTYGHLIVEDLRDSLVVLPAVEPPRQVAVAAGEGATSFAAIPPPGSGSPQTERAAAFATARSASPSASVLNGIRTRVTGLKEAPGPPADRAKGSQRLAVIRGGDCSGVQPLHAAQDWPFSDFASEPPPPPASALTVSDVARALSVSTATVYALCRAGALKAVRLPTGLLRVTREELAEFIARRQR